MILLVPIEYEIKEIVTGPSGVLLIGASFWSSVRRNKRLAEAYGNRPPGRRGLVLGTPRRPGGDHLCGSSLGPGRRPFHQ
ncbi:DUF475 domain-containing protein [Streptomyces sp. NPDC059459]|uniref:DUF475 domain-containing protein n=1 Tax=Streptomyces sp. NPDC059459 TaxID=3346839 RepID=UPI0036B8BA37